MPKDSILLSLQWSHLLVLALRMNWSRSFRPGPNSHRATPGAFPPRRNCCHSREMAQAVKYFAPLQVRGRGMCEHSYTGGGELLCRIVVWGTPRRRPARWASADTATQSCDHGNSVAAVGPFRMAVFSLPRWHDSYNSYMTVLQLLYGSMSNFPPSAHLLHFPCVKFYMCG